MAIETRDDFGNALTTLRLHANLTVRDLANRARVPHATVGGYLTARHLPGPAQIGQFRSILAACGVTAIDDLERWEAALLRIRSSTDGRTGRRGDADPPYLGLEPFQPSDAGLFFGREQCVEEILSRLADLWHERTARSEHRGAHAPLTMLFLVGASGSGKSSLLRAGLFPAIADGTAAARTGVDALPWQAAVMVPTSDPATVVGEVLDGLEAPRVLIIDQFEEVFTEAGEQDRAAFFDALAALGPDTLVVAGMRADYYSSAASQPELVPSLQGWQMVVPPMSEAELRAVVTGPAAARSVTVDEAVVEAVLADVLPAAVRAVARAQALPLLSHALRSAWEHRSRGRLSLADYRGVGGLAGAVALSAEEAYAELDATGRELARRVFLRLINVDEELLVTRRRIRREELDALDDEERVASVVDRFVARRLLTLDAGILDSATVEVSHEALLSAWPRLADWIAADRSGLRVHRRLTAAANAWGDAERDAGTLLRGASLSAAEDWAGEPHHLAAMNRMEREYLAASVAVRDAEVRAASRRTRILHRLVAAMTVLLLVAIGATVVAWHASEVASDQRRTATVERDEALSREVAIEATRAAETQPALAAQLALTAYRISPTVDARSALLDMASAGVVNRLVGAAGPTALRLSPHGDVLAVSDAADGTVVLYRYANDRPGARLGVVPGDAAADQVFALAFSPDGHLLAIGGLGGAVRIFDVGTPAHPVLAGAAPGAFAKAVEGLAFSPDGHLLVAAGGQPLVQAWSIDSAGGVTALPALAGLNALPTGSDAPAGQSVAISPDGALVAVGDTKGTLRVWQAAALGVPPLSRTIGASAASGTAASGSTADGSPADGSAIDAVVFGPDGSRIAVGSKDGTAEVLPVSLESATALRTGFTSWTNAMAYSPDGRLLAVGGADGGLDIFDARTLAVLRGHTVASQVTAVSFSSDGTVLLTASADGTVRSYPVPGPGIAASGGSVFAVGYDRDGGTLAVASNGTSGRVTLWSPPSAAARDAGAAPTLTGTAALPDGFAAPDGTVAISPDGTMIATGNSYGGVALAVIRGPLAGTSRSLGGATDLIESIAFSPDGHTVAAGSDDGYVHLWDVHDPANPVALNALSAQPEVESVAFSPDGTLLAGASIDKRVHLWRVTDPSRAQALPMLGGFSSYAWSVAFSPDSHLLAAGGADDTVRIWDVRDPARPLLVAGPLAGPAHYVFALAFSPDGRTLAAAGGDGSVWTWALSDTGGGAGLSAERTAVLHSADPGGGTYTIAYSPDGRTLAGAGTAGDVVFWDTDPAAAAAAICANRGSPLSPGEWRQNVPDRSYQKICPD